MLSIFRTYHNQKRGPSNGADSVVREILPGVFFLTVNQRREPSCRATPFLVVALLLLLLLPLFGSTYCRLRFVGVDAVPRIAAMNLSIVRASQRLLHSGSAGGSATSMTRGQR